MLTEEQKNLYVSILDAEKKEARQRTRVELINKLYTTVNNLLKFNDLLDELFEWYYVNEKKPHETN